MVNLFSVKMDCVTVQLISVVWAIVVAPVFLDNGHIRIEFSPEDFQVVFVGIPNGKNFLEVVKLERGKTAEDNEHKEAFSSDLLPYKGLDPVLRYGPGVVKELSREHVVAESPLSTVYGVRIRKEIRLYPAQPKASMRVTVLSESDAPMDLAIRNTARLPQDSTIRVEKRGDSMKVLAGADSLAPWVVNSVRYWLVPIPPTSHADQVILGAVAEEVELENETGVWVRRILDMPRQPDMLPQQNSFLCLLDEKTHTFASVLQSPWFSCSKSKPLDFREVWTIKKRGN